MNGGKLMKSSTKYAAVGLEALSLPIFKIIPKIVHFHNWRVLIE